jgi:integration host factor subunit alpha
MDITARRVLTFKPSLVLKDDITDRYAHRIDENGDENKSIAPKQGVPKALSSFMQNDEDSYDDSEEEDD